MAGEAEVVGEHVVDAEPALHLVGAGLGDGDLLELLVDDVVLFGVEARDEARELDVLVGRLLRVAADDERRARLVDEDVVDLVDDGEEVGALGARLEVHDEVVAQEVEAELVVGAVRDVGRVRLAPRDRSQVAQPLVGGVVLRVEQVSGVVLDRSDAHPEPVEDGADPLRVALGQVVVRGDDVNAAPDEAVEERRQRGHERLALAGPHLGDRPAVEHDAAHQLHVVVPLSERPDHRLADGGERLGQHLLQRLVDLRKLALALLLQLIGDASGISAGQRRL